jgi:hypothetical protein
MQVNTTSRKNANSHRKFWAKNENTRVRGKIYLFFVWGMFKLDFKNPIREECSTNIRLHIGSKMIKIGLKISELLCPTN